MAFAYIYIRVTLNVPTLYSMNNKIGAIELFPESVGDINNDPGKQKDDRMVRCYTCRPNSSLQNNFIQNCFTFRTGDCLNRKQYDEFCVSLRSLICLWISLHPDNRE